VPLPPLPTDNRKAVWHTCQDNRNVIWRRAYIAMPNASILRCRCRLDDRERLTGEVSKLVNIFLNWLRHSYNQSHSKSTLPLIHSSIRTFIQQTNRPTTHPSTQPSVHPSIHPFIYSLVNFTVYLFLNSFIYSFAH